MTRRTPIAVAVGLLAVAMWYVAPGSVGAATPPGAMGTVVAPDGTVSHVDASLASQINSGDWANLTISDLERAGIRPNMTAPGYGPSTDSVAFQPVSGGTPQPQTAHKCKGTVCLNIYGSGVVVTFWNTVWLTGPRCTFAGFFVAGDILVHTSRTICGNTYGTYVARWTPSKGARFPVGPACNTWVGTANRPCAIIHT